MVPVGSMGNPSVFDDGTDKLVADAFAKAGIKWASYGSLGFTIEVPADDAERARKILASIPNVRVISSRATRPARRGRDVERADRDALAESLQRADLGGRQLVVPEAQVLELR